MDHDINMVNNLSEKQNKNIYQNPSVPQLNGYINSTQCVCRIYFSAVPGPVSSICSVDGQHGSKRLTKGLNWSPQLLRSQIHHPSLALDERFCLLQLIHPVIIKPLLFATGIGQLKKPSVQAYVFIRVLLVCCVFNPLIQQGIQTHEKQHINHEQRHDPDNDDNYHLQVQIKQVNFKQITIF